MCGDMGTCGDSSAALGSLAAGAKCTALHHKLALTTTAALSWASPLLLRLRRDRSSGLLVSPLISSSTSSERRRAGSTRCRAGWAVLLISVVGRAREPLGAHADRDGAWGDGDRFLHNRRVSNLFCLERFGSEAGRGLEDTHKPATHKSTTHKPTTHKPNHPQTDHPQTDHPPPTNQTTHKQTTHKPTTHKPTTHTDQTTQNHPQTTNRPPTNRPHPQTNHAQTDHPAPTMPQTDHPQRARNMYVYIRGTSPPYRGWMRVPVQSGVVVGAVDVDTNHPLTG